MKRQISITLDAMAKPIAYVGIVMLAATTATGATLSPGDDIAAALEAAQDGETLTLAAGTYDLPAELVVTKAVTISGAGAGQTVLRRAASVADMRLMRVSADATVENLTLLGGSLSKKYNNYETGSAAIFSAGTLQNCEIACCTNLMTGKDGATLVLSGTAVARGCLIRDNYSLDNVGGAVYLAGTAALSNSVVRGNCNRSVRIFKTSSGSIVFIGAATAEVRNCTVTENFAARCCAVYTKTGKVCDSIIWGNDGSDTGAGGFNYDGTASLFVNCHTASDPDFADPAAGDYRLALSSPVNAALGACGKVMSATPACSFRADARAVLAGAAVAFTAVCTNAVAASYDWAVGDGTTLQTAGPSVSHTYAAPGVYTVSLAASGAGSCVRTGYVTVRPADIYVDGASAAPAEPYATPATAARGIAEAVACALSGATVHVAAGDYPLDDILTLPAGVALVGSGFTNSILRLTVSTRAVTILTGSRIEGVTVTGGNLPAAWAGCAGIKCVGGTIASCCVSNNAVGGNNVQGGGITLSGGVLTHSVVCFNKASWIGAGSSGYGGGAYVSAKSVIDTCLFYGNEARSGDGGGIYLNATCYMTNCTVVANTTINKTGGGFYVSNAGSTSKIVNCIFSDNIAANDAGAGAPNYSGTSAGVTALANNVSHCLFGNDSAVLGSDAVSGDAKFRAPSAHDYRIAANSAARDVGLAAASIPADLDGHARDATPDIGCYEYIAALEPFGCVIDFSPIHVFSDETVAFSGEAVNPPGGATPAFTWTLEDQNGAIVTFSGAEVTRTLPSPGLYTVTLSATAGGSTATATSEDTLLVAARTNYVSSAANAGAAFPYATPATAAENIADVLPWLIDGSTVVLDAGRHLLDAECALTIGARFVGQGRDATTITRRTARSGRCFRLNHPAAELARLTIEGGYNVTQFGSGGNILIDSVGGIVRDCTIRAGLITGTYNGTGGAGVAASSAAALVENCVFEANTNNHTTADNWATGAAASISAGTFRNCLFIRNVGNISATVYAGADATLDNCTFAANENTGAHARAVALWLGGAATVRNCLFAGNASSANTAADSGTLGKPNWYLGGAAFGANVSHGCWGGSTALGADSADAGRLRLKRDGWHAYAASSSRDAGLFLGWMEGARDLDGNDRVLGKAPDIGCCECLNGPATCLLLR